MTLVPDIAVFQKSLSALPIAAYQPGETVLTTGSKTGTPANAQKRSCGNRQGRH